jgi:CheY-like chemotaxis protein
MLIVDDNRLQRQIHKRMVEQERYACDVAISGASVIDMAKNGNYCLVLMDFVMSPLDGWTTSKTIRTFSSPPSSPTSPSGTCIVAVTGMRVDERLKEECAAAGMNDVVQKPISPTILSKLLCKHTPQILDR